jgi:hypothetical protein
VYSGNDNDLALISSHQDVVQVLAGTLRPTALSYHFSVVSSRDAINAFLDFAAKYVMRATATVDRDTTYMVLNRMSNVFTTAFDPDARQKAQKRVTGLLSVLPRESYDPTGYLM